MNNKNFQEIAKLFERAESAPTANIQGDVATIARGT